MCYEMIDALLSVYERISYYEARYIIGQNNNLCGQTQRLSFIEIIHK